MNEDRCFKEITNEDIYKEIIAIRKEIQRLKSNCAIAYWISGTSLTLSLILVGVMVRI